MSASRDFDYTANNIHAYYDADKEGFIVNGELSSSIPSLGPFNLLLYNNTIEEVTKKLTAESTPALIFLLYVENNLTGNSINTSNFPIYLSYTITSSQNTLIDEGTTFYMGDDNGQYYCYLNLSGFSYDNIIEVYLNIGTIDSENIDIFDEDNYNIVNVLLKPAMIDRNFYSYNADIPTKLSASNILKDIAEIKTKLNKEYISILTAQDLADLFGNNPEQGRKLGGFFKYMGTVPLRYMYRISPPCPEQWLNSSSVSPYNYGWWEAISSNNYYISSDSHNDMVTYYNNNESFKDYFIPIWLFPDEIYRYSYNSALGYYNLAPMNDGLHNILLSDGLNNNMIPFPTELITTYFTLNHYPTFSFMLSDNFSHREGIIFSTPLNRFGSQETIQAIIGNIVDEIGDGNFELAIQYLSSLGLIISNNRVSLEPTDDDQYYPAHTYFVNQYIQCGVIYQVNLNFLNFLQGNLFDAGTGIAPYTTQTIKQTPSHFEIMCDLAKKINPFRERHLSDNHYSLEQIKEYNKTYTTTVPISIKQIKSLAELVVFSDYLDDTEEPFIWTGPVCSQSAMVIWDGSDPSELEGVNPSNLGWYEATRGMILTSTQDTSFDTEKQYVILNSSLVDEMIPGNMYQFVENEYEFEIDPTLSAKNIYCYGFAKNISYDNFRNAYMDIIPNSPTVPIDEFFPEDIAYGIVETMKTVANTNTTPGTYVLKSTITEVVDDPSTTPPTTHLETSYDWVLETT